MLAAVLTLTRDRLSYTEHCFQALRQFSGMEFHHFVLDQDSKDGTAFYLEKEKAQGNIKYLHHAGQNMGIPRGMNHLVEAAVRHGGYDVIVKIDNDCELKQPQTLLRVAAATLDAQGVISPVVDGLERPILQIGPSVETMTGRVRVTGHVGGIFMCTPVSLWSLFRYPEDLPHWGTEDDFLSQWAVNEGMTVGYLEGCRVNHYRTTEGQHEDFPSYFLRRQAEGGPA